MNLAADYLTLHWERLGLRRPGDPAELCSVLVTPRFRASAHVVFLMADRTRELVLVAKVARLPSGSARLAREAACLRAVQAARPGGFDSIPRLLACEEHADTQLLLETALAGRPLNARLARRHPHVCAEAMLCWAMELAAATASRESDANAAFNCLVARPLEEFRLHWPVSAEEHSWLTLTLALTAALAERSFPLVFVHGDLSAPNLLLSPQGDLQVVDWELAGQRRLPAEDLFFGLAFLAFARRRARSLSDYTAAFRDAFFGPGAWTRPYLRRYVRDLGLPPELVPALFVACWSRYATARAARLLDSGTAWDEATVAWLRRDRFFVLWRYAVEHATELCLT